MLKAPAKAGVFVCSVREKQQRVEHQAPSRPTLIRRRAPPSPRTRGEGVLSWIGTVRKLAGACWGWL